MEPSVIDGLRALVEFLEDNPSIPRPKLAHINVFAETGESPHDLVSVIGEHKASVEGNWYEMRKAFGPVLYTAHFWAQDVCVRVKTTVEKESWELAPIATPEPSVD